MADLHLKPSNVMQMMTHRITPTTWVLQALASDQLGNQNTPITDFAGGARVTAVLHHSELSSSSPLTITSAPQANPRRCRRF